MSSTQHRCVFVGNIPYDATEEELIRICEEVGPVVNFRLVVDRETGKPKGYGFCEYRDEETALSARRNLQGYEINGRQLRVDFAENEKGSADRNREQGRGGPGLVDISKQALGPKVARDLSLHQAVGIPAAASAANLMASLLGAPQISIGANGATRMIDPLTVHLAGMSKYQLYEIIQLMKNFIQQNQQQARHVLVANPQLVKALFQAQIILGVIPQIPPQIAPSQGAPATMVSAQGPLSVGVQQSQPQRGLNIPFHISHPPQQQPSSRPATMLPSQPLQVPPPHSTVGPQQWAQPQLSVQPPLPQQARPPSPSRAPQTLGFQYSQSQQLPQQPGGSLPALASLPYQGMPPPLPTKPPPQHLQGGPKVSSSAGSVMQSMKGPGTDMPIRSGPFASWSQVSSSMVSAVAGTGQGTVRVTSGDGSGAVYSQEYNPSSTQPPSQQQTQVSLEPEQQKALLQQVMNLTPEQINSLPPEQRQQVLDLQQAFRNQII